MEAIDAAFNMLTGRFVETEEVGRFAQFYRKAMFHYKGWVVLTIIVLAVMAMIVVPIATRRVPDLTISFAGEYGAKNLEEFDEYMQLEMPEVEDILTEVMYLDEDGESGEFDTGGRTRLTAILLTNEADILITDDSTFNYIRQDDALMLLNDILDELDIVINPERYIYGINFKTGEKKVYGISVGENELVADAIYGNEMRILCIAEQTQHIEDVKKAMEIILKDRSE